jgi:integrase
MILAGKAQRTQTTAISSLNNFERVAHPKYLSTISTRMIAAFVKSRRAARGTKPGSTLSPASINRDLRHLKAALAVAVDWGYLPAVPKIRMERELVKLPVYVTAEHFAAIYRACESAKMPKLPNTAAPDWWCALLTMAYMTGWRIGDLLALKRKNLDLPAGTAKSLAEDNKGKRDELVDLHPIVIEHLKGLAGFEPPVFPWHYNERTLYSEFWRIQKQAGIHLECNGKHKHTPACHYYGFHDLRRAFATMNAERLTPAALQSLMRHKSFQTTQKYINATRQLKAAVQGLHVPIFLQKNR